MNNPCLSHIIVDLDGTLMNLDVNWAQVRKELEVISVGELWSWPLQKRRCGWRILDAYESDAASRATLNQSALAIIKDYGSWSLLTNNGHRVACMVEQMVHRFSPCRRASVIQSRESLQGPKESFPLFSKAIGNVRAVTGTNHLSYLGDQDYELSYATRLGLEAIRAAW